MTALAAGSPRETLGRVAAALALGAVFALAFWGGPLAWGGVTLALLAVAATEWARLGRVRPLPYAAAVVALSALAAWLLDAGPDGGRNLFRAAALFWAVFAPLALLGVRVRSALFHGVAGALVLVGAWMAGMALYRHGPMLLVLAVALVAVSDSAAYFAGRRFGRKRMAPRISPRKTWEGVAGSFACVCALGVGVWLHLGTEVPLVLVVASLAALLALSVLGDLYESTLKRDARVSDSGRILPGHGGALDLVDGMLPVLPFVALTGGPLLELAS